MIVYYNRDFLCKTRVGEITATEKGGWLLVLFKDGILQVQLKRAKLQLP